MLIFAGGPAFADPISNGTDYQFTDTTTGDPTVAQVLEADEVAPFSFGSETGTVESWVYGNSAQNPYIGTVDNPTMTFVYQITLTSPGGDIASLGAANFGLNNTDVGYYDQTGSQVWPTFVSRDLDGDGTSTVTFSFLDLGGNYSTVNGTDSQGGSIPNAGQPSALLVVNTDGTTFTNTYVTLQDDSNGAASSYAIYTPMVPTPEPGSIVLMTLGLLGLLAVARARRSGRLAVQTGS